MGIYWNSTVESSSFRGIAIKDDTLMDRKQTRGRCWPGRWHGQVTKDVAVCMFFDPMTGGMHNVDRN